MTADPFAAYRPKQEPNQIDSQDQQEDPFSSYRPKEPKKEPEEGLLKGAARQGARALARGSETVLGAPRAFGEFLEGLVPEQALKKGAEKIGLEKPVSKALEFAKEYAPYKAFPTSEQVRSLNESLFGKAVKPKNEWEAKSDELISDFTALALPVPGTKAKFLKPALLALGGNAASELLGSMGGTEKEKTYAKLGTFLVGSLVNPGGAKKLGEELYAQARASRPERVKIHAPMLNTHLNQIERELARGGSETWKPKITTKINELRDKISGNNVEVGELERFKTSLNNITSELYAEKNVSKPGIKSAKRYANKVAHAVDEGLKDYGKQNPTWEKLYREANEVYGSIAQSNKVKDFISRNLGKISPHLTASLFAHGNVAQTLAGAAGSAAAGGAALESGALLSRIYKSPKLRKYYYGVVQNALREDAVAMRDNLRKLEEGLEEER